jgi:hypothetical protein
MHRIIGETEEDSVMKQPLDHPRTRRWCLVGLIGIVLSATVLLDKGQARTLTTTPPMQSVRAQDLHATGIASKPDPSGKNRVTQSTNLPHNPEVVPHEIPNEEKPHKKKFGLAILFLGVLAEKS